MCGIVGFYSDSKADAKWLDHSIRSLGHRGPDGTGVKLFSDHVGFGHSRLSIIDLSEAGSQPMCNEDQTIWITYNGEIYNFQELKEQLKKRGHCFKSNSDTEVLIHGYEEWGKDLLEKLKGMFAFAIWNMKTQSLFLARDRFGIKPLCYYADGKSFAFSSELKALTVLPFFDKKLRYEVISDYLNHYCIPAPKTIWQNTYKLLPGHYIVYSPGKDLQIGCYWHIKPGHMKIKSEEAIETSWSLLKNSVQRHLLSDVPIGLFLSSGYDSSALLSLMKELEIDVNTYTIGFKNSKKSEHIESKEIATLLGSCHHEQVLDDNFMDILEELSEFYDEPLAVTSMVSYFYVSRLAHEKNKVVLSGDGGDEVFGGYKWYNTIEKTFNSRSWLQKLLHLSKEKKKFFLKSYYYKYMGSDSKWARDVLVEDLRRNISSDHFWPYELPVEFWELSPVKIFQLLDFKTFIPNINLPRTDISAMANSLEVRVPFLDNDLVDFMMGLDESVYFKPPHKKILLKKALEARLPRKIIDLPKKGFGNPLDHFYSKRSLMLDQIKRGELAKSGILAPGWADRIVTKNQLWILYILHLWWNRWNHK